jgi:tetratricopeptide (TPR) repeat protein
MRIIRAAACVVILNSLAIPSVSGLFMTIGVTSAAAQQDNKEAVLKRFKERYAAGDYEAALLEAQTLERMIKARYGVNHANYAVVLNNLAIVYSAQGKYPEAEELLKRDLAISERTSGANHPSLL